MKLQIEEALQKRLGNERRKRRKHKSRLPKLKDKKTKTVKIMKSWEIAFSVNIFLWNVEC